MEVDRVHYIDCPNCKFQNAELFNGEEECLVCGYSNFNNPPYYSLETLNERREESWNLDLPTFVDDENDEEIVKGIAYKDSKYFLTKLPKQTYGVMKKKTAMVNLDVALGTYNFPTEIDVEKFEEETDFNYEDVISEASYDYDGTTDVDYRQLLLDYCVKHLDKEQLNMSLNADGYSINADDVTVTNVAHEDYAEHVELPRKKSSLPKVQRVSILDGLVEKELSKRNIILFDLYKKSKLTASKFLAETKCVADNAPQSLKATAYAGLINFTLHMRNNKQNELDDTLRSII